MGIEAYSPDVCIFKKYSFWQGVNDDRRFMDLHMQGFVLKNMNK